MTSLLDVLKETDLRVGFAGAFKSLGTQEALDRSEADPGLSWPPRPQAHHYTRVAGVRFEGMWGT